MHIISHVDVLLGVCGSESCRTLYTVTSQSLFTVLVVVIKNIQLRLFLCYMYVYYGKANMKNVNKKRQKNTAFTFNTKYKLT